jgi:hypothetical protein
MKKITLYLLVVCTLLFVSCQEDPEPGGTATEDVAGEWWVGYYIDDGSGNLIDIGGGYYKAMTFNTASNKADSLWVTDLAHLWDFQVKVGYNASDKTFSISEGQNVSYDSKVTIEDGQFLLGQGKSTSGVKTDSIYFVASFDDETTAGSPTPYATKFIVAGHRRTGFLEDEHE